MNTYSIYIVAIKASFCFALALLPSKLLLGLQPAGRAFLARHHCAHPYHPINADAADCSTTVKYERRKTGRAG